MDKRWYTAHTDFLSQLAPSLREELLLLGTPHRFRKHELIFQAGSPGDHVYLLASGRAKIYQLSSGGKEIIQWFCFPGELFGMAEVCHRRRREVYARACSNSEVVKISQDKFKSFIAQHPDAAMLTVEILSCRLRVLGDMLLNLTAEDVMSRLLKLLTRLCLQYGKHRGDELLLDIPLTHQDIADMIGASRQTVSSAIGKLRRRGLIEIDNHCIQVHNPDELINLSSQPAPANACHPATN